jgi:hypothetical protein
VRKDILDKIPSVQPTAEFVQTALQMFDVQPVKGSLHKSFRVGDDDMRPMEMNRTLLGVKRDCRMNKSFFCKSIIEVQPIRSYLGARFYLFLGKWFDRFAVDGFECFHPREFGLSPIVERNGRQNGGLFCSASAFTAFRGTAEKTLVHFHYAVKHVFFIPAAHRKTVLLHHRPCRKTSGTCLPLLCHRAQSAFVLGNKVYSRKLLGQRRPRLFHDRSGGRRGLMITRFALIFVAAFYVEMLRMTALSTMVYHSML